MILDLQTVPTPQRQQWLNHAVAPRPICFASTMNKEGNINLSPFSFFNLFSVNPPIVIFSASRRVRDNTTKHTLQNVLEVPEVVVNMVDYNMVQQTSLASCEYPREVNEFIKAGFTPVKSQIVGPPGVLESKIRMECKVTEVKPLGTGGGAGNLVICEVLLMHIDDSILNIEGSMIDQRKMHYAARLGGDWYSRVGEDNLFRVEKPSTQLGIGIDVLPESIRTSKILSGNDLGQLANVHEMPMIDPAFHDETLKNIFQYYSVSPDEMEKELQRYAKQLLEQGKTREAWQVLLAGS